MRIIRMESIGNDLLVADTVDENYAHEMAQVLQDRYGGEDSPYTFFAAEDDYELFEVEL